MPQQTRLHIIHILERRETASARDLSLLLNVTPANIRHHLSALIEQGSIKVVGYKVRQERGRPSAVYSLAQPASEENLKILSNILLNELLDSLSPIAQEHALRWLAQRLTAGFPQTAHNPTQRLYLAIEILNKLNFRAQWEAHADTPRIMFGHCPYITILEDHPEMCQVDEYILEHLTGDPASQVAKLASTPDGHRQCIFRFTKK